MTPLRVCIDARLGAGQFGGVEQVVIGLAAALSRLEDGDEEYLFLTHPRARRLDPPYSAVPAACCTRAAATSSRRSRAVARAAGRAAAGIGVSFAVRAQRRHRRAGRGRRRSTSRSRTRSLTDDPEHLPAARPPAPPPARAVQRLGARPPRGDLPRPLRAGGAGRRDDLLGRARLHRELRAPAREGDRGAGRLRSPRVPGPHRRPISTGCAPACRCPTAFLLYPAQTWPHKNHERLLEALARIRDESGIDDPARLPRQADAPLSAASASSSRALGLAETTSFPGLRQLARAPRPLRAGDRAWSSRAGSRAGGCRSARPSTPGSRSRHRPRRACPTWSATRAAVRPR